MVRSTCLAVAILASALAAAGCVSQSSYDNVKFMQRSGDEPTGSLFWGDQAEISNDDVNKILGTRVVPPTGSRVTIVRFDLARVQRGWSEEFMALDQQNIGALQSTLRSSPRLSEVWVLPSLLAPREMTIPQLRKAAARMQADLIFVYRTADRRYKKYELLGGDSVKGYVTVEAAAVDTRSGLVVFTSSVTRDFTAQKGKDDVSLDEATFKAQQKAVGEALGQIAGQFVTYLNGLPKGS